MIESVVDRWMDHLRGDVEGGLDALLSDDVVLHSPIIHTPIVGKSTVRTYLEAAGVSFAGTRADGDRRAGDAPKQGFRYTRKTFNADTAVLEFETTMNGKHVNGVDIIRADANGQIVEFRVMVRPLQAVHAVHELMRQQLEAGSRGAAEVG